MFRGTVKLKHPKGQEHAAAQQHPAGSPEATPPPHRPLTIGLVTHAQDDLRGAVVACNHIGRHKEAGGSSSGQAEVQNLQGAIRLYHNVAGLQVLSRHTTQAWFRGGGTRCWFEGGIGQTFRKKNPRLQTYISLLIHCVLSDFNETDFILVLVHMTHLKSTGRPCPARNKHCNETLPLRNSFFQALNDR